ncbi:helix-turn-helix domain-containing protein [Paenibacillus oryzisoli]|uniref:helix-turn-helix domain-containing protein n=1 Tax=Paenibacillus oryzisoli TaxID=1850517 RepID=UPI003D2C5067
MTNEAKQPPIKVLLVDDEYSVLETLRNEINWSGLELDVVAIAENGEKALQKCALYSPDIVITDITMPVMDGLQFMEAAKRDFESIKFVILTAHRDFEYAQQAISMGALAYLIKAPLENQVVEQKLAHCRDEIRKERELKERLQHSARMFSNYSRDINRQILEKARRGLDLQSADLQHLQEATHLEKPSSLIAVYFTFLQRSRFINQYPPGDHHLIEYAINQTAAELLEGVAKGTILPISPGSFLLLLSFPEADYKSISEHALSMYYEQASRWFSRYFGVQLLFGASERTTNIGMLGSLVRSAEMAIEMAFYESQPAILYAYEHKHKVWDRASHSDWMHLEAKLMDKWTSRQLQDGLDGVQLLRAFVETNRPSPIELKSRILQLFERLILPLNKQEWESITDNDYMDAWFAQLERVIVRSIRPIPETGNRFHPEIKKAIQYIVEHLDHSLTLQMVADHIHLNPSYLSHLFKLETGSNFLDYVTEQRIAKAKELMAASALKNYEIAEQLGFQSYPHFCTVFKKTTGLTPKEYRSCIAASNKNE